MASSNIALPEQSDFILSKSANNRVKNTTVVEKDKVTLLPVLGVDILGRDARSLNLVNHLSDSLEIIDDGAISEVQLANSRRVNLNGELASEWVLPCHR